MNCYKKQLTFLLILLHASLFQITAQTNHSFEFDGTQRSFIVYVPEGLNLNNAPPLLIALHGFTQNGANIMEYSGFNAIADEHGFVVTYPNGLNTSWNVGQSGADDVGFLLALTDTLQAWHGIDPDRVYVTGFSNGGFMSYRMACEASERIAAIAAVAGTMPLTVANLCQPERNTPVMHIHGTADFIVPYGGNSAFLSVEESIEYWKSFNNCPSEAQILDLPDLVQEGSTVQQYTWAPCDESTYIQLLKINGGGHTWPGYDGFMGIGNTNMDINASVMIWDFLQQFSLGGPVNTRTSDQALLKEPYPNPLRGNLLYVPTPATANPVSVKLMTAAGKTVLEQQINSNNTWHIDMSRMNPGFFILIIQWEGNTHVFKIIKI